MPVNFKMNRALTDATIARLGITKIKLEYRIALDAFLGNFKIKTAKLLVKIALKTRHQSAANVTPHVTLALREERQRMEA